MSYTLAPGAHVSNAVRIRHLPWFWISLCAVAAVPLVLLALVVRARFSSTPPDGLRPLFCEWELGELGSGWEVHRYVDQRGVEYYVDREHNYVVALLQQQADEIGGSLSCESGRAVLPSKWGEIAVIAIPDTLLVVAGPHDRLTLKIGHGVAGEIDGLWGKIYPLDIYGEIGQRLDSEPRRKLFEYLKAHGIAAPFNR